MVTSVLHAQYEDQFEQPQSRYSDSTMSDSGSLKSKLSDKFIKGTSFFINPFYSYLYSELSPFVGLQVKPWAQLCVGVTGMADVPLTSTGRGYLFAGPYAFSRVILGEQFFFQAEYDMINAPVLSTPKQRQWISSPIIGGGYINEGGSWIFIGYALDRTYAETVPMSRLVYRIGITF